MKRQLGSLLTLALLLVGANNAQAIVLKGIYYNKAGQQVRQAIRYNPYTKQGAVARRNTVTGLTKKIHN